MKSNYFSLKNQSNMVPFVAVSTMTASGFCVTKNVEHVRYTDSSGLSTISFFSNETHISMLFSSSPESAFSQQDFFGFLDFLDDNLLEEDIVIADKEQLMRIASLFY